MTSMAMKLAALLLVALCAVASGQNACLQADFRCNSGDTVLAVLECGITDADIPELQSCLTTMGRSGITILNLSINELSTLPADFFEDMEVLRLLILSNNQFTSVPASVSSVESLEQVFLTGNPITSIDESAFPPNLTYLILSNTLITSMDDVPLPPTLEYLTLSNMDLGTLSASAFDNLGSLIRLVSLNSSIATIEPGAFKDLVSLERLELWGNLLETVPSNLFEAAGQLEYLDLSDNRLAKLPEDAFAGLSAVEEIYLHNNALTTLPAGLFKDLGGGDGGSLSVLNLDENPDLQCLPEVYVTEDTLGWTVYTSNSELHINPGMCECTPAAAIICAEETTCAPGEAGYTCNEATLSECSNGILGIDGSNDNGEVCCPIGCNQCGGDGCGSSGAGAGLSNRDCCVRGILRTQDLCSESGTAPCVL